MTGTAVLMQDTTTYIVLEEVERTMVDSLPHTINNQYEAASNKLSLIGFKEEEIDWDYGY